MKSENILNSKEELVDDGWGDCWEGTIPVGAKLRLKIDGSLLLDNQALCIMLNISKRTLQRYRAMGLVCKRIRRKTYYLESDVQRFM
ncbi:MAG: helix-turn-helix domain-containing protein, partial [Prevotella sp.]|nr:helix-turn-helix domain-containing protein [Prevotella sp.]